MGGRGSGGGRSGRSVAGGGGRISNTQDLLPNEAMRKYTTSIQGFTNDINSKLKKMSDLQLNQQYSATKKAMKKAVSEYKKERDKFIKMNKEFDSSDEKQKDYNRKIKELSYQMRKSAMAQEYANMREHVHYLVVNEKFNVRGKNKK